MPAPPPPMTEAEGQDGSEGTGGGAPAASSSSSSSSRGMRKSGSKSSLRKVGLGVAGGQQGTWKYRCTVPNRQCFTCSLLPQAAAPPKLLRHCQPAPPRCWCHAGRRRRRPGQRRGCRGSRAAVPAGCPAGGAGQLVCGDGGVPRARGDHRRRCAGQTRPEQQPLRQGCREHGAAAGRGRPRGGHLWGGARGALPCSALRPRWSCLRAEAAVPCRALAWLSGPCCAVA